MAVRRNALGRGLGALIPGASSAKPANAPASSEASPVAAAAPAPESAGPRVLPVRLIDPNPEQPRRVFDPAQLDQLAASIRRHGVLQPVVVRRAGDRYELLVGERRWRASQAAGLTEIPAVIADVDPSERLEIAIVENVQRHDLNPIELAIAYRALADAGATQDEIGERVGLDRSSIANHLRLLELSRALQEDVEGGRISMGHAKALLQVSNPERRRHLRDRILEGGLSVRETEKLAREIAGPSKARKSGAKSKGASAPLDPQLAALVEQLQQQYQTRVRLQGDAARGRIEIEYFGAEDLQRVSKMLLEGAS